MVWLRRGWLCLPMHPPPHLHRLLPWRTSQVHCSRPFSPLTPPSNLPWTRLQAMLGFLAAVGAEIATGQTLAQQWTGEGEARWSWAVCCSCLQLLARQ